MIADAFGVAISFTLLILSKANTVGAAKKAIGYGIWDLAPNDPVPRWQKQGSVRYRGEEIRLSGSKRLLKEPLMTQMRKDIRMTLDWKPMSQVPEWGSCGGRLGILELPGYSSACHFSHLKQTNWISGSNFDSVTTGSIPTVLLYHHWPAQKVTSLEFQSLLSG